MTPGSIPRLGRSPGEGNGNPPQYSCLENPMEEEPGTLQSMGLQRVRLYSHSKMIRGVISVYRSYQ